MRFDGTDDKGGNVSVVGVVVVYELPPNDHGGFETFPFTRERDDFGRPIEVEDTFERELHRLKSFGSLKGGPADFRTTYTITLFGVLPEKALEIVRNAANRAWKKGVKGVRG